MIESSDAIVLKAIKYGDTSKIVTLYTRRFGRMGVIAKGARSAKSKFGSALEPMSLIHAVFYRKENRELQLLSQADLLRIYHRLMSDERKLTAGLALIEFLHAAMHEEEEHPELFDAAREALESIDDEGSSESAHLIRFLLRLASLLGFAVDLRRCSRCGAGAADKETDFLFHPRPGLLFCDACTPSRDGIPIAPGELLLIGSLESLPSSDVARLEIPQRTLRVMFHLALALIKSHIQGLRKIHSLPMVETILFDTASKTGEN